VVDGQIVAEVASIGAHDGAAVAYVDYEYLLLDEQCNDSARPALVEHVWAARREGLDGVQEVGLCLLVAVEDGLAGVLREGGVLDDELVEVVAQEIGAGVATVAVEDAKEAALGPVGHVLLGRWLHDVEHDADAVFVVVADDALVGVRCVADDVAVLAHATFGGLPAGQV